MSLKDTCDELEEALAAASGPQTYGRYIRALVKLGEEQLAHIATRASYDLYKGLTGDRESGPMHGLDLPGEQRFAELKKRVEGL